MTVEILEGVLLLSSLVVVSNIINHYFSFIPTSLIQISFGIILALAFQIEIPLKTDWFLLLFIAPLLFNDARTYPKKDLWELRAPIIANSIVLVFATTLLGGIIIYYLIPGMPIATSFALAAILSPTDPVAVKAITEQAELPKWITNLVGGESLINDASGLIGFKYGVAATVTGTFSLLSATGDFFYISLVGALVGFLLISLLNFVKQYLVVKGFQDITIFGVMQFLTPFLIYFIAESVHASGVIAVVVAGIFTSIHSENYLNKNPEYVVVTNRLWEMIVYVLEGIIFLILGIELPVAMIDAIKNPLVDIMTAVSLIFIIWLMLFAFRVAFIYSANFFQIKQTKVTFKNAILSGLTGVRGALTMAGALSVPYILENGQDFPDRALFLFIAGGVIVLSLLMAVIFIPILSNNKNLIHFNTPDLSEETKELVADTSGKFIDDLQAKNYIYRAAIAAVEEKRRQDENQLAALDVIDEYEKLIRNLLSDQAHNHNEQAMLIFNDEIILRKVALRGEANKLEELFALDQVNAELYQELKHNLAEKFRFLANLELDVKVPWTENLKIQTRHYFFQLRKQLYRIFNITPKLNEEKTALERELAKNAIKYLSDYLKEEHQAHHQHNRRVIYHTIITYRQKIANLKAMTYQRNYQYDEQLYQLRLMAFAAQRTAIIELLDHEKISFEQATKLREEINFAENALQITSQQP